MKLAIFVSLFLLCKGEYPPALEDSAEDPSDTYGPPSEEYGAPEVKIPQRGPSPAGKKPTQTSSATFNFLSDVTAPSFQAPEAVSAVAQEVSLPESQAPLSIPGLVPPITAIPLPPVQIISQPSLPVPVQPVPVPVQPVSVRLETLSLPVEQAQPLAVPVKPATATTTAQVTEYTTQVHSVPVQTYHQYYIPTTSYKLVANALPTATLQQFTPESTSFSLPSFSADSLSSLVSSPAVNTLPLNKQAPLSSTYGAPKKH